MHPLSTNLKRKSIEKAEPTLPKPKNQRQPSSNSRTIYKELKSPSEQLKQFNKKQLNTVGNLSTDKSLSHLHSDQFYNMKHSRFDDDHHNTQSMAQLLQTKKNSLVQTVRQSLPQRKQTIVLSSLSNYLNRSSGAYDSLQSQQVTKLDSEKKDSQDHLGQPFSKQGQNYDDYVLGDKISQEDNEEDKKDQQKMKKYTSDHKFMKNLNGYKPENQSQFRMEQVRIINQRKRLLNIQEDREILAYLQEYKNNKRNILNQIKNKNQIARIMAMNNSPKKEQKMEKSVSLPALKPKQEILIIPEESHYDYQNKRNVLAKNFSKQSNMSGKGKEFLSYGKLGFGRKKIKQQQMETLQNIKAKLREKGIAFDASKLKKGLINFKNEPQYKNIVEYPALMLPSNPIYKKFPL